MSDSFSTIPPLSTLGWSQPWPQYTFYRDTAQQAYVPLVPADPDREEKKQLLLKLAGKLGVEIHFG